MQWFEKTLDSGSKWKCAHIVSVWTVENASKWKRWPKISQVHVLVAWTKSLTYITTCNSIVFKCFSVHGYWKTCQKGSVDMKRSMCFQWQHTFEKALVWSGGPFRPGTCVPTSRGPRKHLSHEMRGKEETLSKLKDAQQDAWVWAFSDLFNCGHISWLYMVARFFSSVQRSQRKSCPTARG